MDNVEQEESSCFFPCCEGARRQKGGHANTCNVWISSLSGAAAHSRAVLLLHLVPDNLVLVSIGT